MKRLDVRVTSVALASAASIACYEIVPVDAAAVGGGGASGTTSFYVSAASSGGKGEKVGASSASGGEKETTTGGTSAASGAPAVDLAAYRSCRDDVLYEGDCSAGGRIAFYWRGDDATHMACGGAVSQPEYCALNFCTAGCSQRECTAGGFLNAACFDDPSLPVARSCREPGIVDTCQDDVAIVADPTDDHNCLIRDCRAEGRACVAGDPPRCL